MLRDPFGLRELGNGWSGSESIEWAGGSSASLSASQLVRRVKDVVQKTIHNYHANPEETAAEESWDYVQFQVREAPPTQMCTGPSSSGTLTWPRPLMIT